MDAIARGDSAVPVRVAEGRFLEDEAIPISVRIHSQGDLELHRHGFTELVIVIDGTGEHLFDDERFPIAASDVFVIDQDHAHGYDRTRALRIVNVLFQERYLIAAAPTLQTMPGYQAFVHLEPMSRKNLGFAGRLKLAPEAMTEVRDLVSRISYELKTRSGGYVSMATALLVELLVSLCRAYTESDSETHRDLLDIGRVIGYIENNFRQDLPMEELTRLVAMSERSLLRKFRGASGTSPRQYHVRVRISHASRLLRTSNLSVTDIASEVGFDDSSYFSRRFRQIHGMSPTAFRRASRFESQTDPRAGAS